MWHGCLSPLLFLTIHYSTEFSVVVMLTHLSLYWMPLMVKIAVGSPGPAGWPLGSEVMAKSRFCWPSTLSGRSRRYQGILGHCAVVGKPLATAGAAAFFPFGC